MSAGQPLVLCVEDDLRTLDILIKVLGRLPVRQVAAREARTAIDLAGRLQPELLILDLMLPEVDGFAVLDALRADAATQDIPVIVITAKALTPPERERLAGRVESLLQKGAFMDDELTDDVLKALMQRR